MAEGEPIARIKRIHKIVRVEVVFAGAIPRRTKRAANIAAMDTNAAARASYALSADSLSFVYLAAAAHLKD